MPHKPFDIAPLLAPLPTSMIIQALTIQGGQLPPDLNTTVPFDQEDPSQKKHIPLTQRWAQLYTRFEPLREEAYELTQEAIDKGDYSTQWMIDQLTRVTGKPKPLSSETISRWRSTGLFVYEKDDWPDEDSATAMLILRLLTKNKMNAWTPKPLPGQTFHGQPLWYCWRQDGPNAPVIPCRVPLSLQELPEHALLWTDWVGADRKNDFWTRIGNLGCCRWAHIKPHTAPGHQSIVWDISEKSLSLWGIDTASYQAELEKDAPLTLHMLANLALLKLATQRLKDQDQLKETLKTYTDPLTA